MDNQNTYILIGSIGHGLLWVFYKILKHPKIFLGLLGLTVLIAVFGYVNIERNSLQLVNGSAAECTFWPLLFMVYYWLLRKLFLKMFKNEPLMTSWGQTSWEQGEYRRLHMGDFLFTILTLVLPMLTTFLI